MKKFEFTYQQNNRQVREVLTAPSKSKAVVSFFKEASLTLLNVNIKEL